MTTQPSKHLSQLRVALDDAGAGKMRATEALVAGEDALQAAFAELRAFAVEHPRVPEPAALRLREALRHLARCAHALREGRSGLREIGAGLERIDALPLQAARSRKHDQRQPEGAAA